MKRYIFGAIRYTNIISVILNCSQNVYLLTLLVWDRQPRRGVITRGEGDMGYRSLHEPYL